MVLNIEKLKKETAKGRDWVTITCTIRKKQHEFIKENNISIPKLVMAAIDELQNQEVKKE